MGFAAGGICHATVLDAAKYVCGVSYPSTPIVISGFAVQYQCSNASSSALTLKRVSLPNLPGTASTANITVPFEAVACDPDSFGGNPFALSLAEGALISAAVLGVWAIAACWRELAAFIQGGYSSEELR